VAETESRLNGLREKCLTRDHHRCVITRAFDLSEARARTKRDGAGAKDDDKHFLYEDTKGSEVLQVAHIIPHSLMSSGGQLESKKKACNILDMFDNGVLRLIEGVDIDRPANALTLTLGLHQLFGDFEIYFEPTSGAQTSPTYTIHQTVWVPFSFGPQTFPVTRTLLDTDKTIDLPSPRLLAIHRAVALILHLSGAGEYIDHILKDMDYTMVKSDGTTELGHLVSLRLGGWWDGIAVY
jgi:HNH endonuclease